MKPFRFTLDKVLKVRQHQSMLCKHALASAQLQAGQAWASLENARLARSAFESDMEQRRAERLTAQKWAADAEQHGRLAEKEKVAAEELHRALAHVATKRAELEDALRRERILEKLRVQQWENHQYSELAEEQLQMDEMAANTSRDRKGAGIG